VAGIIAFLSFVGFLLNPTFRPAIVAIIIVYVVVLAIFAIWGRHHLVLSPEEKFAVDGERK
jgi:ethanolamine permease